MFEAPGFPSETVPILFWVSWLVLFYLAWPRLVSIARRLLRKRSAGRAVKLIVPPLRPRWDLILEKNLARATLLFLGLSVLELLFRRPQLVRFTLPLFALCLGLTMLVRWWRSHSRQSLDQREIVFPHVSDRTALGLRLLKVEDLLQKLRHIAVELAKKGEPKKEVAVELRELIEKVRKFLVEIRLEPPDSPVLRQARSMFIRLETLTDSFELLAHLSDEAEVRGLSNGLIEILTSAKSAFEELRLAQSEQLTNQIDILISVLRHLYKNEM